MPGLTEQELKLTPEDDTLLDRLAVLGQLGPFVVAGRHRELQRNCFFDTSTGALRSARVSFRRRQVEGQRLATWTVKGAASWLRGVTSRTEIEVQLDPDTPPAIVIGVLRQAARERGALALAEQVADALSNSPPPLARPYLELAADRQVLDLEAAVEDWAAELALDRVRLLGHTAYAQVEIEVELKRGSDATLDAARAAVESLGAVRDSPGSKLGEALAHAERCPGC